MALLLAAVALSLGGCWGKRALKPVARFEGVLIKEGHDKDLRLTLKLADGSIVEIQSEKLQAELTALAGMRVAIEGDIIEYGKKDMPIFDARRYYLLRLPTGEMTLIGELEIEGEILIMTAQDGRRYWIRGEYAARLRAFDEGTVWVVGKPEYVVGDDGPEVYKAYWVTRYGILDEGVSR
jgi:hypothetical protein